MKDKEDHSYTFGNFPKSKQSKESDQRASELYVNYEQEERIVEFEE